MIRRGNPASVPALVLYPQDSKISPSAEPYRQRLREIGLIGEHWRGDRYLIGEQFLDLICFLGCAPDIDLAPLPDPNDLRFCHLHIPEADTKARLRYNTRLPAPACPQCRKANEHWHSQLPLHSETSLSCPGCGISSLACSWHWRRRQMCFSHFAIEIFNVYDNEAVPAASLLEALAMIDDVTWNSCYITP